MEQVRIIYVPETEGFRLQDYQIGCEHNSDDKSVKIFVLNTKVFLKRLSYQKRLELLRLIIFLKENSRKNGKNCQRCMELIQKLDICP